MEGFAPDEMGITLDTYWVAAAGADVCEWIRLLKRSYSVRSFKKICRLRGWNQIMAPVMEGNLKLPSNL